MTTIAHISDLHFGTEDPAIHAALLAELDGVTVPAPTLVAISGDLTQRAREREFELGRVFLDRLRAPYLVVPGNHDLPLYNVFARLTDGLRRYRTMITSDLTPSYTDEVMAVVGVATPHGFTIKDGRISAAQTAEACARLGPDDGRWKIVVAHHPLVVPEGAEDGDRADGADAALVTFRHAGINMILTGHLHVAFNTDAAMRSDDHRVINVHAGTCMSTRTRGEPNSYNRITFVGDEVTIRLRTWRESQFVDGTEKVYRRVGRASGAPEIQKLT
ncbi:metallophosphoesterase [soil metagenome]